MRKGEYKELTSFKKSDRWKSNTLTQRVNKGIEYVETDYVTQINNLWRAIITFVGKKLRLRRKGRIINRKSHVGKEELEETLLNCEKTLVY